MEFQTQISGYTFVCITEYENALHKLREMSSMLQPIRITLLHDIKILEDKDKNTFAKSIRLLDKFHKEVEQIMGIKI